MDSVLIALLDGYFFLIGQGAYWVLKKARIAKNEPSHGGAVVAGLLFTLSILVLIFVVIGVVNDW